VVGSGVTGADVGGVFVIAATRNPRDDIVH